MTNETNKEEWERRAKEVYEDIQDGYSTTCADYWEENIDVIAQSLQETANQKLKEGMERALGAVEKFRAKYGGTLSDEHDEAITAIRKEIDKLTQPK